MEPVNLYDSATYEREIPHAYFTWLREHEPIHWQPPQQLRANSEELGVVPQRGYWAVTRHEDVIAVSLDQERFSSERATVTVADMADDLVAQLRLWMINQDAPRHTKLRKLINKGFTKRMVQRMDAHVRELTTEILDAVSPKGECDFVQSIASQLPLLVIAELVGADPADRTKLFDWSNQLIGFEDPEFDAGEGTQGAMAEMFEYASHLAARRRDDPRDDLTSALVHAEVDGERLDDLAFNMFFILLILAGNETTRNAISGGMQAFDSHRDQWEKLRANPSLMPQAVEETLRFVSPVIAMRRTATRDTELAGQAIAENDKLVMFYPSANRDAAVFDEPDRFDITRDPNPHLAFGWGPHFCLGASLARAEISVMFEALVRRMPDIEICGPVRRLRSTGVNSIKSMPVRFTPGG